MPRKLKNGMWMARTIQSGQSVVAYGHDRQSAIDALVQRVPGLVVAERTDTRRRPARKQGSRKSPIWDSVARRDDGCWVWLGAKDRDGYGRVMVDGRTMGAHRIAYEESHGPVPDGLVVMHSCDNPSCVNPDHLRVGTQAENIQDRDAKGRTYRKDSGISTSEPELGIRFAPEWVSGRQVAQ